MTREEIEKSYNVVNGRICSPGKFEGEMLYVPFFWDVFLNGFCNRDDGEVVSFYLEPEDRVMFPELGKRRRVLKLIERSDGFVCEV